MPRIGSKRRIHQMGQIAHTTVSFMFKSFKEIRNQSSITKRNFLCFFLLATHLTGVVNSLSDQSFNNSKWMKVLYSNHAAALPFVCEMLVRSSRSTNVTEFSHHAHNPSVMSAISMSSQWRLSSGTLFCGFMAAFIKYPLYNRLVICFMIAFT